MTNFGSLMRGAVLGLALTGFATAAEATAFRISDMGFSGSALSDPGLVVQTDSLAPINFGLNEGDSITLDVFQIWTNENQLGGDDIIGQSLQLSLTFDLPPPPFGGSIPGETDGGNAFDWAIANIIPEFLGGDPEHMNPSLEWDGPVDIVFGGDGLLRVTMFDTGFNNDGPTTVQGKFELVRDATNVPEPGTVALLGAGLLGLGLLRRRHAA